MKTIRIFIAWFSFVVVGNAAYIPSYELSASFPITINRLTVTNFYSSLIGSGNVSLFTIPSGKRAFIQSLSLMNVTNATITVYSAFATNGTYYRVGANTSASTNGSAVIGYNIILEENESFAINTSAAGMNVWGTVLMWPNSLGPYSPRKLSLSSGNNTIYTVPAGRNSHILNSLGVFTSSATINYHNASGGSRTLHTYAVPSGGSPGEANRILAATVVNDGNRGNLSVPTRLNDGEFLVLNTDASTATQIAWVNVLEH